MADSGFANRHERDWPFHLCERTLFEPVARQTSSNRNPFGFGQAGSDARGATAAGHTVAFRAILLKQLHDSGFSSMPAEASRR
jgi:hypothetical protein